MVLFALFIVLFLCVLFSCLFYFIIITIIYFLLLKGLLDRNSSPLRTCSVSQRSMHSQPGRLTGLSEASIELANIVICTKNLPFHTTLDGADCTIHSRFGSRGQRVLPALPTYSFGEPPLASLAPLFQCCRWMRFYTPSEDSLEKLWKRRISKACTSHGRAIGFYDNLWAYPCSSETGCANGHMFKHSLAILHMGFVLHGWQTHPRHSGFIQQKMKTPLGVEKTENNHGLRRQGW